MAEKPTNSVKTVNGIVFRCWHTGILQYEWRSEDGRRVVRSMKSLYSASVDRQPLKHKFRTLHNAMKAASAS